MCYTCSVICYVYYTTYKHLLRLRLGVSPLSLLSLKLYSFEHFKFTDQLVMSLCNVYLCNLSCHTGHVDYWTCIYNKHIYKQYSSMLDIVFLSEQCVSQVINTVVGNIRVVHIIHASSYRFTWCVHTLYLILTRLLQWNP